jgi:hypothetical protein
MTTAQRSAEANAFANGWIELTLRPDDAVLALVKAFDRTKRVPSCIRLTWNIKPSAVKPGGWWTTIRWDGEHQVAILIPPQLQFSARQARVHLDLYLELIQGVQRLLHGREADDDGVPDWGSAGIEFKPHGEGTGANAGALLPTKATSAEAWEKLMSHQPHELNCMYEREDGPRVSLS